MAQNPQLLVRPLHGEPFRFSIDKPVVSIGRSKRNDLVLADQWLSRNHAEIRLENGAYYICDLQSRNGTMVNGVRISSHVPLQSGDVVTLGDQTLTFDHESSGSVILSDSSNPLDMEGTLVVPTEKLLAAARGHEDTWDDLVGAGRRPSAAPGDNTARIIKQNQVLTALSQASMALISERPLSELLEFILDLAVNVVKAERGFLMLTQGGNGNEREVKAVRSSSGSNSADSAITFSSTIVDKVVQEKVSILTKNAMDDPRFRAQESVIALRIRSAMCVPLWNNQNVTGIIYVDSRIQESVFTEDDLTLLSSLANVAAIKLENAQLLEEMIEKKRMEHELELAGQIQKNLLPSRAPQILGWDLTGSNAPCYTIGGDYFDFIERSTNRLAFALADVSGKGASAALMMAVLRATVHSTAQQQEDDVVSIMSHANHVMYHNSPAQSYATFFLGDLDPGSGELLYINAGHIPPILFRAQSRSIERLETGGTVVGLFEMAPYEKGRAELAPGDILVVFTDGVSESWDDKDEEFGEERLGKVVQENADLSAADLLDKILAEVDRHTKGDRPSDDRTLIIVKRVAMIS